MIFCDLRVLFIAIYVLDKLSEAAWRISTSVNKTFFGSGNGLSSIWCQVIIWASACWLGICNKSLWNCNHFTQEIHLISSANGDQFVSAPICSLVNHSLIDIPDDEDDAQSLIFNRLWPSDAIWRQRTGSPLSQAMVCCLMAPSHYLNQCWIIISEVFWHSPEDNFTGNNISHWHEFEYL